MQDPRGQEISFDEREATSTSYCIGIAVKMFRAITQAEFEGGFEGTLGDRLEKIDGVFRVEYNGHFGANLFLNVESDHNTSAKWKEIREVSNAWIAEYVTDPDTGEPTAE